MAIADLAGSTRDFVRAPVTVLCQLWVARKIRQKLSERDVMYARCVVCDVTMEIASYLVTECFLVGVTIWRFDGRQFIVVRTQHAHQRMANHHHLGEVVENTQCVVEAEVAEW